MTLSVGANGRLAPDSEPHPATLEEIYQSFVVDAPFRDHRELVFRGLGLFIELVTLQIGSVRFWINGGFTTHKSWAPPADVDVATIVPRSAYDAALTEDALPLWTLQHVSAADPTVVNAPRLQPMGGLVDSFFVPDLPAQRAYWHSLWSKVKGEDGKEVPGERKGYVEVIM